MSGSCDISGSQKSAWTFRQGDLVGFAPSRVRHWNYDDGYMSYGLPVVPGPNRSKTSNKECVGIIIEVYEKYGYYSSRYYKIKWSDTAYFSNEKHEDLILISHGYQHKKTED